MMKGLDKVFTEAGFQIRQPGCSACLAMNDDKIPEGEYCVSTSNRNFEGRQGQGARTILASPLTAAKVAVEGRILISKIKENAEAYTYYFNSNSFTNGKYRYRPDYSCKISEKY